MNTRERFTKWYVRKGYTIRYDESAVDLMFTCPWWVRILAEFFFSPSVYYREVGVEYV